MGFYITFFILPAQAAQAVNIFANAFRAMQKLVEGVRKLLPYQLCWPLSQPKVKEEIHPKHIFSNAALILPQCHLLVCCISLSPLPSSAQSPSVYLPSDTKFVSQQQGCSAWEKWDLEPREVTETQPKLCHSSRDHQFATFVANKRRKGATKAPRDAVGGITEKKKNIWVTLLDFD